MLQTNALKSGTDLTHSGILGRVIIDFPRVENLVFSFEAFRAVK